jgi:hypothetical protein
MDLKISVPHHLYGGLAIVASLDLLPKARHPKTFFELANVL